MVQGIKQCSVSQALEYLSQFDFSFQQQICNITKNESKYEILSISEVKHNALIQYLKERRIEKWKRVSIWEARQGSLLP